MSEIAGAVIGVGILVVTREIYRSIHFLKEKEVKIIERLGRYHYDVDTVTCRSYSSKTHTQIQTQGVHFVMPFIDRPKTYTHRYYVSNNLGQTKLVEKKNCDHISTWVKSWTFPSRQSSREIMRKLVDDSSVSYRQSEENGVQHAESSDDAFKNLQAQIRNIAGLMDVDQVIEETAALNRISIELDRAATRWGAAEFVRVQRVEAGS